MSELKATTAHSVRRGLHVHSCVHSTSKRTGRVNHRNALTTLPVRAPFPTTLSLKNFDSAVRAAPAPPRYDSEPWPCPSVGSLIVNATSEQGGRRQWR